MTQPERSDCARTSIIDWWRWREPSTRRKLLAPIGRDLERLIGTDWRLWVHPAQKPPGGAWSSWLILGGRGAGKTRAGAEWLTGRATPGARLALVGPTLHDVREVMVEGPSGLRAVAAPWRRPIYEAGRRRLTWPNGATAYAFSAEDADSLRGPQFHAAWCDEFCAWRRPGEVLAMLRMGLRLGDDPRLMITTTPRPITALKTLMAEPGTVTTRAATAVNRRNLSANFLHGLNSLYGGTRLAEQELDESLTRLDFGRDERGLPLLFRAAPAGAPPGGAGATSQTVVCLGVHDRPWSPVHLRWRSEGGDMIIGWLPRRRLFGDGWDADRSLETGLRFRLRILDGAIERRTIEVEGLQAVYPQAAQMSDFPGGLAAASVEVSQWGEGWGWGPAARLSLAV